MSRMYSDSRWCVFESNNSLTRKLWILSGKMACRPNNAQDPGTCAGSKYGIPQSSLRVKGEDLMLDWEGASHKPTLAMSGSDNKSALTMCNTAVVETIQRLVKHA